MNARQVAKHNARLSIAINFLTNLSFILPIWLLYSLDYLKFSPTLAVSLFMVIWVTSGLLEIPTGALADRLGRKQVFIIGSLLLAVYPIVYITHPPLLLFIIGCFIGGVGQALTSGTLLPVVHEAYKKAGLGEKQYHNFLSSNQASVFIARAVSGLAGAALYHVKPTLPFLALSVATLLSASLGLFFLDNTSKSTSLTNRIHIGRTLSAMLSNQGIVLVLAAFAVCNLAADSIWTGYQVLYQADGRSAVTIGALFSIIAIFSTAGAFWVRRAPGKFSESQIMFMFGLATFLTALLLWQPHTGLRLLAVAPMGIMSGTTIVSIRSVIQQYIVNELQSTALSVSSFITFGTYAIGSLMFGLLVQTVGSDTVRSIFVLITLLAAVTAYILYRASIAKKSLSSGKVAV